MTIRSAFDEILANDDPLGRIDAWIWQGLSQGSKSSVHPWNVGYFSTVEVDEAGAMAPRTRTVILRAADQENRGIDFYTDIRTTKVGQLRFDSGNAEVCWLFYDPATKIQLRLEGAATLLGRMAAEQAWQRTPLESRSAYVSTEKPGVDKLGAQPPETGDRIVTQADSERGRENFQVVRTKVRVADLLYLRREGHVRARSDYQDPAAVNCKWVVP